MLKIATKPRGPVAGKRVPRRKTHADRASIPNAETRAAIEEARRGDLFSADSVEEMWTKLNADD